MDATQTSWTETHHGEPEPDLMSKLLDGNSNPLHRRWAIRTQRFSTNADSLTWLRHPPKHEFFQGLIICKLATTESIYI